MVYAENRCFYGRKNTRDCVEIGLKKDTIGLTTDTKQTQFILWRKEQKHRSFLCAFFRIQTLGWTEIKRSLRINCGILGAHTNICRSLLVQKN